MTWWLLLTWIVGSAPLGVLTAKYIAWGNTMTEPPGNENGDWIPWGYQPPPYKSYQTIELWREEWGDETSYVMVGNVHCAMNVAGLWWRRA